MKIRVIIIVLSLSAFLSIGLGGYLYYSGRIKSLDAQAHAEASHQAGIIAANIDARLTEYQKSVKAMSGLVRLKNLLSTPNRETLHFANQTLDHFRAALEVDVCYLMDAEGSTVASSNRNDADSFVGKNYKFRPYFTQAYHGRTATYMALGVTSLKRGIYFSHPVYQDGTKTVAGVVVIKASVMPVQHELEQPVDGVVALIDPNGVVFAASRSDWLYHILWKIPESKKSAIIASQQFGAGPLDWAGLEKKNDLHATDRAGNDYMIHETKVSRAHGWKIVYLHDMKVIASSVYMPFFRAYGYSVALIALLAGIAITFLYVLASKDITKRKQAEKALVQAHNDLARKVEERTADLKQSNEQLKEEIVLRKQTEERLKAAKEHLQAIYDASPDMIFVHAADGSIIDINKNVADKFGYSKDEMQQLSPQDTSGKGYTPEMAFEKISAALRGEVREFEWVAKKKSGEEFPVEVSLSRLELTKDDGGREFGVLAVVRDITEKKKIEEHLRQSQKIEAVGKLAGGVAHDFNNILMGIMGYGDMIRMRLKDDDPIRRFIDQILSSSERAAKLTRSLLAFSRKQIIAPKPSDLNDIIRKVGTMLSPIIGEDIDLKFSLADEEIVVMVDAGQIEQVLMNLATNARDAMPEGGSFTISTEAVNLGEDFFRVHGQGKPGRYAMITAADSGVGMDEKIKQRIFEPFYTTKEVGKGTGLGLAMTYGIIKQHNGFIDVASEPGKGTSFRLYLPVASRGTETQPVVQKKESAEPAGGTEIVLIAEDDAALRTLLSTALHARGYTVIEACDGVDAVQKFMKNKDEVKIAVLDVIMPGKNGKDAYDEMKKAAPGLKAIFVSGYAADILQKKGALKHEVDLVLKPVSPAVLLKKIREVLDA